MIHLDIQAYCQSCPDFTPDIEKPEKVFSGHDTVEQTDTIIRCKYRKRCESIKRYIEKTIMRKDA